MGEEIIGFVQELFITTTLPKALTASFLALIPETQNPQMLEYPRRIESWKHIISMLQKIVIILEKQISLNWRHSHSTQLCAN